ncbi:hypothetical protein DEU56DRAFT_874101 [Suillus clintonianus]|uniref:uncharacterized protein n=1 Tax=Suillus clintonianus TaxID=1904413 RepID=UPI001B873573|nr:uncharacterized protein DEU56DRAFT_874101 [Suillus clintonianus]KAG2117617.1 hypothetical protein DEU56DRAFT_874101 [Suillus clintonianus]
MTLVTLGILSCIPSLWHIIWSCCLTIFACTWTAIHPNIPGMYEGRVAKITRRALIMGFAMAAPELVVIWALRQLLVLAKLQRKLQCGWTMTHGFFARMGGFMLYVNDEPRGTLTPYELLRFVSEKSVEMPVISKAEIEDRSKGDPLSKGIAVLQLVWFVSQLIARYVQNLPITLLEIDTLAIAALTCISYGLWWKKPKDVGCPYAVHWTARALPSHLTYKYAVNVLT